MVYFPFWFCIDECQHEQTGCNPECGRDLGKNPRPAAASGAKQPHEPRGGLSTASLWPRRKRPSDEWAW